MVNILKTWYCCLLLIATCFSLNAQIEATGGATPPYNPIGLIENEFLGKGIQILNITYEGSDKSVGYFNNGSTSIGIENGILLTTGVVESSGADSGVNESGNIQASADNGSAANDVDLQTLSDASLFNVAKYTIEFIPTSDTLSFRYVFASEEYPEFVCSDYSDLFGFFVSGPGISGPYSNGAVNIATIPGTALPVTINNVNGGIVGSQGTLANCSAPNGTLANSQYYTDNDGTNILPVFDGWLSPFEAKIKVTPCETYIIKIVIADQGDPQRDSGVFLEAKSFESESVEVNLVTESIDGSIIEGCAAAELELKLSGARATDTNIGLTFLGDAINGTDIDLVNTTITIPAGNTSYTLPIAPIEDGISEGVEDLKIVLSTNTCQTDTTTIYISDFSLSSPVIPDTLICPGESVSLNGALNISQPPPITYFSGVINEPIISPLPGGTPTSVISIIEVAGVDALQLGPNLIQSVCINIQHKRLEDLNIYLRAPGGQLIPLSTNNGGTDDDYINTCFSPSVNDNIVNGSAPFTGDWSPEGNWENLWYDDSPTNGTWQLEIVDEVFGFQGILTNWEITFNPIFSLTYDWGSTPGLSCYDCPNPLAQPSASTTYSLTVTDATGCTVSDDVAVNISTTDFGDAGMDQTICAGGDASLTASGGDSYLWSTGESTASITVSPSSTDSYQVTVTNSANCTSVDEVAVVVGTSLSATLDKADISCLGADDGSITANSSGTAPLTYAWSNGGNTQTIDNLSAGNYTVTITDASTCSTIETVEILEPALLVLSASNVATCIDQSDGTASVTVQSGGTGSFTYLWDANAMSQTTATASNLAGGNYMVTVTDANSCEAIETAEVTTLNQIATPIVTCGNISATAITFVWSPDPNATSYMVNVDATGWVNADNNQSHQVSGLALGQTVNLEIRGEGTCPSEIGSTSCTTINCTSIVFNNPTINSVTCFGESNGAIAITVTGDNPPFTYSLNGVSNNTGLFSNLSAGDYVVSVEDNIGCRNSTDFSIAEPSLLTASANATSQASCNTMGAATAVGMGGTEPYTYLWSTNSATASISNLPGGDYTVSITDANNCVATTSVSLQGYTALGLSVDINNIRCFANGSTADASTTVTGGRAPFTYAWSDPMSQTTATAVMLSEGTYAVTVMDDEGCSISNSLTINTPQIQIDYTVEPPPCADENGAIFLEPVVGLAPYTVRFGGNQFNGQLEFNEVSPGTYDILIEDSNGCSQEISGIEVPALDPIDILQLDEFIELKLGDSIQLMPQVINTIGVISYEWSGFDMPFLSCTDCAFPFAKPTFSSEVDLKVTDANGCMAIARVEFLVDRRRHVYIPTAISPNNDGMNDFFTIYTDGDGQVLQFLIFDRWGNMVFERESMDANIESLGWNGQVNEQGANNNRVYTYVIKVQFDDGEIKTYDGSLMVIR